MAACQQLAWLSFISSMYAQNLMSTYDFNELPLTMIHLIIQKRSSAAKGSDLWWNRPARMEIDSMSTVLMGSHLGITDKGSFIQWKSSLFYSTFPLRRPDYYVDPWGYIARSLGRNKILHYSSVGTHAQSRCLVCCCGTVLFLTQYWIRSHYYVRKCSLTFKFCLYG